MRDGAGEWIGWGLGDVDPKVAEIQSFLARKYSNRAGWLVATGTYDQATADVVAGLQDYYGVPTTAETRGVFNWDTQKATGFVKPTTKLLPLAFTVEGHLSDMWRGPAADTAAILEKEGRVIHRPTGYNNGAIPFDNLSGEIELARRVGQTVQDDGVKFPAGTPFFVFAFSQGAMIATDFLIHHLTDGDLAWRAKDCLGFLLYGNPSRDKGAVAPWSRAQAGPPENAGMEPIARLDLLGIKPMFPVMNVYRRGDIFADNEPGIAGQIKAALYLAIGRGDIFSNPFSVCAQIAAAFTVPVDYVMGAFQAMVSGVGFLGARPNPHYDPFDITGGLDWARDQLALAA
ncbi:hypothetical protein C5U48_13020 [Mycolicibacter virginiensis]|uniref:Lysin B n=1 Tax=Mycolicibacter virginiensis TaxID=1795032 RepID=A0A9X7IMS7_9MYCO|nr:PE-PPE domain-containing protein [Mycolicibacter virginiensis]PQM51839.1 hypothetical protein C5U48_13020 [Mycolicibacter virginiensis]